MSAWGIKNATMGTGNIATDESLIQSLPEQYAISLVVDLTPSCTRLVVQPAISADKPIRE